MWFTSMLGYILLFATTAFSLRYILVPFLLESLLQVRIRSVSPRSIRGIEWTSKREECRDFSPRLKIERLGLQRSTRSGGWITISVEKPMVSITRTKIRSERVAQSEDDSNKTSNRSQATDATNTGFGWRSTSWGNKLVGWIKVQSAAWTLFCLSLAVQQSPWLAHLIDIRIEQASVYYKDGDDEPLKIEIGNFSASLDISFDQAPELIVETISLSTSLEDNVSMASPLIGERCLLDGQPSYVVKNGLISPPPSVETLKQDKPTIGIRRSRSARIMSRVLGRARGKATLTLGMGPVNLTQGSGVGVQAEPMVKILELIDKSRLGITAQFGGKAGILGKDSIDASLHISPIFVNVLRIVSLERKWRSSLPRATGMEQPQSANMARQKELLDALHSITFGLPYTTLRVELDELIPRDTHKSGHIDLSLNGFFFDVRSASPSSHHGMREVFGRDARKESTVTGASYSVTLEDLALTWNLDRQPIRKIADVGAIQLRGFTTWRPQQWRKTCRSFAGDPNLHLVDASFSVDRIHLKASVPMLARMRPIVKALQSSDRHNHSRTTAQSIFMPRVHLYSDFGHSTLCLMESDEESASLMELSSGGLETSIVTDYRDVCAVRRTKARDQKAHKAAEDSVGDIDFPLMNESPVASGSATLSDRDFSFETGQLQDDITIALHWECSLRPRDLKACVSYVDAEEEAHEIISLGDIDVRSRGVTKGRPDEGNSDAINLLMESGIGDIDVSVAQGIKITLSHPDAREHQAAVLTALQGISPARTQKVKHLSARKSPLLSRLPSGMRIRLAVPSTLILLASRDPNPACKAQLHRGLQIQLGLTFDYCSFRHISQSRPSKLDGKLNGRRRLRLPLDATEQAAALHNQYQSGQTLTAYSTFSVHQIIILPIYNAVSSSTRGRPNPRPIPTPGSTTFFPRRSRMPSYAGWDFQRVRDHPRPAGDAANNMDPFPISLEEQAQKPLLVISKLEGSCTLTEDVTSNLLTIAPIMRAAKAKLSADISHVYCALLALKAFPRAAQSSNQRTRESISEPALTSPAKASVRFRINIDDLMGDLALPLKERLFFSLKTIALSSIDGTKELTIDSSMVYVPSPRAPGRWEEFGRLRRLEFVASKDDNESSVLHVAVAAVRIRIPFRYELSKLVLNISSMVKAIKLLMQDMHSETFVIVRKPTSQPPKRLPRTTVELAYFSLEIKDDPLETKLNLIWRVGLNEQADRLERTDAFAAKVTLLDSTHEDIKVPMLSSNLDDLRERWGFDSSGTRDVHSAAYNLAWYNAQAWKNRFDKALSTQNKREEALINQRYGNRTREEALPIDVMPPERFAPLFRVKFEHFGLQIKPLDLNMDGIIQHMEDLAGPFPRDTTFSLLVPIQIQLQARSVNLTLRDYPMPLFQIRPPDGTQNADRQTSPSFEATIDLVAGEEMSGDDSYVLLTCPVLPEKLGSPKAAGLGVQIAKTLMPVKTYTRMKMKVATDVPTDFTWGNSYQPAIEDLMKAFEKFTHPPRDPSPKMGFWDKFRLTLHWRISVDFAGPCHLHLKGSRDPYHITGFGAGFVLAWMGAVKLRIGEANAQRELIQISSDEMFFSIPDLSAMIDNAATGSHGDTLGDAGKPANKLPGLLDRRGTKTCARFVGGVRVGFGFKFERTCRDHSCSNGCRGDLSERRCRLFDFKPHHQVKLRSKDAVEADARRCNRTIDSFEGFRSDFIHFSPSITTFGQTIRGDDGTPLNQSSSFHFTPKGFAHFFAWWRLFNHVMSLPIRQGKLFPKSPPAHRKFGRSLATIKYRFDISDLYISHFYPQMSKADWTTGRDTALGVKAHIQHFQADLHQREQTKIVRKEALQRMGTIKHKPFYAADVILEAMELRAISTVFESQSKTFLEKIATHMGDVPEPDGKLVSDLPHDEAPWFNADDYVDTDGRPADQNPRFEMHELGFCPQFHYSRWLPALKLRPDVIEKMKKGHWFGTDLEASKFGKEPSHQCLLGEHQGTNKVAIQIVEKRRDRLVKEIEELRSRATGVHDEFERHAEHIRTLQASIAVLDRYIEEKEEKELEDQTHRRRESSTDHIDAREVEVEGNDFQNVYQIYLPHLVLNNQSRNILMKYYYSSRLRKGLEYYLSNKALKLLREQLGRINEVPVQSLKAKAIPKLPGTKLDWVAERSGNAVAKELLKLVMGDNDKRDDDEQEESTNEEPRLSPGQKGDPHIGLPKEYTVSKSHYLLLLGPQLALSSELDAKSTILFTMDIASFKGYTIGDDEFVGDPVNSRVMHRNYSDLKGLQGFYPRRDPAQTESPEHTFVPIEVLLDAKCQSMHFDRVLPKTDGYFHYDKFNQLRLSNDLSADREQDGQLALPEHIQHKQDLAELHVPRLAVMADSHHYTALYNVVTDLILYQDPEQRQRSQKMDTFVYSFDRRDAYRYVTEVTQLQQRIRESESLIKAYEEHYTHLAPEGKLGLIDIRADLLSSVENLNMIYDAVSLHRNYTERAAALKGSIRLKAHAGEVAWYMFGADTLLAKVTMTGTEFDWIRKKDSSTDSTLTVADMQALNSSPDAVFPEMLAKYQKGGGRETKPIMTVRWAVLAPVGGITIMERLHVDLHPIRVQVEKKIGRQLMDYVFAEHPRSRKNGGDSNGLKHPHSNVAGDDISGTIEQSVEGRKQHKLSRDQKDKSSTLSRQSSQSEIVSAEGDKKHVRHSLNHMESNVEGHRGLRHLEADEMHDRATKNITFVSIDFAGTTLVLSYKGDKPKSITDLYDFKFTCPALTYGNKTWSFETLAQHIKKDIIRSAWQQKGALIREVFKKTRKPARQAISEDMPNGPSKLRLSSRPFDEGVVHPAHAILPDGPLVESPVEEAQTLDLERSLTTASVESSHSPKDREKHAGKLGKLVGRLKSKATNRHHSDA